MEVKGLTSNLSEVFHSRWKINGCNPSGPTDSFYRFSPTKAFSPKNKNKSSVDAYHRLTFNLKNNHEDPVKLVHTEVCRG